MQQVPEGDYRLTFNLPAKNAFFAADNNHIRIRHDETGLRFRALTLGGSHSERDVTRVIDRPRGGKPGGKEAFIQGNRATELLDFLKALGGTHAHPFFLLIRCEMDNWFTIDRHYKGDGSPPKFIPHMRLWMPRDEAKRISDGVIDGPLSRAFGPMVGKLVEARQLLTEFQGDRRVGRRPREVSEAHRTMALFERLALGVLPHLQAGVPPRHIEDAIKLLNRGLDANVAARAEAQDGLGALMETMAAAPPLAAGKRRNRTVASDNSAPVKLTKAGATAQVLAPQSVRSPPRAAKTPAAKDRAPAASMASASKSAGKAVTQPVSKPVTKLGTKRAGTTAAPNTEPVPTARGRSVAAVRPTAKAAAKLPAVIASPSKAARRKVTAAAATKPAKVGEAVSPAPTPKAAPAAKTSAKAPSKAKPVKPAAPAPARAGPAAAKSRRGERPLARRRADPLQTDLITALSEQQPQTASEPAIEPTTIVEPVVSAAQDAPARHVKNLLVKDRHVTVEPPDIEQPSIETQAVELPEVVDAAASAAPVLTEQPDATRDAPEPVIRELQRVPEPEATVDADDGTGGKRDFIEHREGGRMLSRARGRSGKNWSSLRQRHG